MLFAFDFSETKGGQSCETALNVCEGIFFSILSIARDINMNYEITVSISSVFATQFSLLTAFILLIAVL